jgi:hypothetical protein
MLFSLSSPALLTPRLSSAVNDRTATAIIGCVALHPQSWHGADVLIADMALQEFGSSGWRSKGVGMRELSRVNADPDAAAQRINALHRTFRIGVTVKPDVARRYIYTGAVHGIEVVRRTTQSIALELGIALPQQAVRSAYRPDTSPQWARLALWLQTARLHQCLRTHPELRIRVVEQIGNEARGLRAVAREWQREVVAKDWARGGRPPPD